MTLTKDGRIAFVALRSADHVAFVDTATRTIRDYVKAGKGPREVALNAGESTLYVVNALSNDLSIVDVPNHTVIETVHVDNHRIWSRPVTEKKRAFHRLVVQFRRQCRMIWTTSLDFVGRFTRPHGMLLSGSDH
jgi:YVTN family beta-propeller protein